MKSKIFVIIGILFLLIGAFGILYHMESSEEYYYSQIDNLKVETLSSKEEMRFRYTLDAYQKNGKKKTLTFKTSKKLREGAFIKLRVLAVSGVNRWEEIPYEDLPKKVQVKYSK